LETLRQRLEKKAFIGTIHKTGCVLCAQNCGLTVEVENNRIIMAKSDKSNTRCEGYFCRKGMNIAYHQHNVDRSVDAENEEAALVMDSGFPLVLMAERHISIDANTLMRDSAWNEGKRACTLAVHPNDAASLKLTDGQQVRVVTEAGSEEIELEVSDTTHIGHVVIPHGFGLVYNGKKYGVNMNRLIKNTLRDQFDTPIHRYVPCRMKAL
jgi:anaerobic selenocysteine-containing dehydrogenase